MNALTFKTALPVAISTARLVLRAPMHADVPALVALANNRKIHEVTRVPYPYTSAEALSFVEEFARRPTQHPFAITSRNAGFVGVVGLSLEGGPEPELGYWLGEPHWGKGYATEAARALVAAADATRRFPALVASALAHNRGSINVLTKTGFIETHRTTERRGAIESAEIVHFRREREL